VAEVEGYLFQVMKRGESSVVDDVVVFVVVRGAIEVVDEAGVDVFVPALTADWPVDVLDGVDEPVEARVARVRAFCGSRAGEILGRLFDFEALSSSPSSSSPSASAYSTSSSASSSLYM